MLAADTLVHNPGTRVTNNTNISDVTKTALKHDFTTHKSLLQVCAVAAWDDTHTNYKVDHISVDGCSAVSSTGSGNAVMATTRYWRALMQQAK